MNHPSEEELILYFYGESDGTDGVGEHVRECARCQDELSALRKGLAELEDLPVPERPDDYGQRVWARVSAELPRVRPFRRRLRIAYVLAGAAAAALLLLATFLAGRYTAPESDPADGAAARGETIRERVLLVALSDHLDQSQVLLLELVNRGEASAVPLDRERAAELLQASRLYRQTAFGVGDVATADVLEELEKILLDVSQGPDSAEALQALRSRIEERDMLFKLRVLGSTVRKF